MKKIDKSKLYLFGSVAILSGTITLMSCNANNKNLNDTSISNEDTELDKSDGETISNTDTKNNNINQSNVDTNNMPITIDENETEIIEVTVESENQKDKFIPEIVYMTAEDLVKLSEKYVEYVNKTGIFITENYIYSKFETKDLYSTLYLSNIECFNEEETKRLIENGIISDNIFSIIDNSWKFFNFYQNDTLYKLRNENKDLIDLSMLFINDEKAKKVFNTMNTVLNEMMVANNNKLANNFVDTYAYFATGTELPISNYNYSKSIYDLDRSQLTAGSLYTLGYMAEVINFLSIEKEVTTNEVGNSLSNIINDRSDIIRIFDGCIKTKGNSDEISKSLSK